MSNPENRIEERTSHVSIVKYCCPSLKSKVHDAVHYVVNSLANVFPSQKEAIKKLFAYRFVVELLSKGMSTAITLDLSSSGIGVYTTVPLGPGQKLLIVNTKWQESPIPATVRWCERHSEVFYRAGLMYNA